MEHLSDIVERSISSPQYDEDLVGVKPFVIIVGSLNNLSVEDFPEIVGIKRDIAHLKSTHAHIESDEVINIRSLAHLRNHPIIICGSEAYAKSQYTLLRSAGYNVSISRQGTLEF
ncbi:MAG: hypothetical protein AABW52_02590 [Nanoarchaeota archaeon]